MVDAFNLRPESAELLTDVVATQLTLPAPVEKAVDIYIGVPFCPTRCRYCSFISMQVGDGKLTAPYVEALIKRLGPPQSWCARRG